MLNVKYVVTCQSRSNIALNVLCFVFDEFSVRLILLLFLFVFLQDNEAHDQLKKSESQPAVMPDYAAGLIAPELDVRSIALVMNDCVSSCIIKRFSSSTNTSATLETITTCFNAAHGLIFSFIARILVLYSS